MNKRPGWLHLKVPLEGRRSVCNILLIVCAAAGLVFAGAMVTYAILKTVTPTVTNVFKSDKGIRITLDEPEWEEHGKQEALAYVPGQKIDKDPTVTLETGSVDAYVALKVQYYDGYNQEITREEFNAMYLNKDNTTEGGQGIDYSDSWEYIGSTSDGKGDIYVYRDILTQDSTETAVTENVTQPLFTRVYLSKDISQDKDTKRLPEFNIKITAYAIQAAGITYDEAKADMSAFINQ